MQAKIGAPGSLAAARWAAVEAARRWQPGIRVTGDGVLGCPAAILVTGGDPARQLVCASRDVRLVVLGSDRSGRWVATHLLRHSHCPVLIVRP